MFDMPGTEIRASLKLSQASPVAIKLSQRHHAHDVKGAGNTKNSGFQENAVVVWIDGVRQGPGGSNATFTTTKAQSEAPVSFPATTGNKPLAAGTHTIRIFKATEADWNGGSPAPNYLTFYGIEVQGAKPTLGPLPPLPTRKIEFLGGKCKPLPAPARQVYIVMKEAAKQTRSRPGSATCARRRRRIRSRRPTTTRPTTQRGTSKSASC